MVTSEYGGASKTLFYYTIRPFSPCKKKKPGNDNAGLFLKK